MRIYHVATLADWRQAQETGTYTTSTYGRTLEEVGFIHAARHDQVPTIRDVLYADVTEPLVVLEVETDLLGAEVRDEEVGDEVFPHVYGPIPTSAVVAWRPARLPPIDLGRRDPGPPAPPLTVAFHGLALVLAAGALVAGGCAVAAQAATDDGRLPVGVSFVLWSLMGVLTLPAGVAYAWAEWVRRTTAERADRDPA
jgi:glutathione S-transferase